MRRGHEDLRSGVQRPFVPPGFPRRTEAVGDCDALGRLAGHRRGTDNGSRPLLRHSSGGPWPGGTRAGTRRVSSTRPPVKDLPADGAAVAGAPTHTGSWCSRPPGRARVARDIGPGNGTRRPSVAQPRGTGGVGTPCGAGGERDGTGAPGCGCRPSAPLPEARRRRPRMPEGRMSRPFGPMRPAAPALHWRA
jgi:hypothetical protein